jgi:hypothetical protein
MSRRALAVAIVVTTPPLLVVLLGLSAVCGAILYVTRDRP